MHSRGDEMRRKYLYRVGLAILPVWMGRYIEIVGEKSSESIADTLINGIFGRVTGDAGSRFVIAIGQAIFLVLFLILYGDCIAARQRIGAVYFFSRISNRKKWILKDFKGICLAALLQCALYILFCGNAYDIFHLGKQRGEPIRDTFQGCISDWPVFDAAII